MTARFLSDVVKAYDVRGTVPDQLDVEVARALGAAFADVVLGPDGAPGCVIGNDMRDSGPSLVTAFADGVRSRGLDVTLIGLCSTDGLYYASGALDLPGAMFTASHNPARYNGIKLCRSGARPVGQDSGLTDIRVLAERLLAEGEERADGAPGAVREHDVLADYAGVPPRARRPLGHPPAAGRRRCRERDGRAHGPRRPRHRRRAPGAAAHGRAALLRARRDLPEPRGQPARAREPPRPPGRRPAHTVPTSGSPSTGTPTGASSSTSAGEPVSPSAITALIALREVARAVAEGADPADVAVVHNVITSAQVAEVSRPPGRVRCAPASVTRSSRARWPATMRCSVASTAPTTTSATSGSPTPACSPRMHVLAALGEQEQPLSEVMADLAALPSASGEVNSTVADAAVGRRRRAGVGAGAGRRASTGSTG